MHDEEGLALIEDPTMRVQLASANGIGGGNWQPSLIRGSLVSARGSNTHTTRPDC